MLTVSALDGIDDILNAKRRADKTSQMARPPFAATNLISINWQKNQKAQLAVLLRLHYGTVGRGWFAAFLRFQQRLIPNRVGSGVEAKTASVAPHSLQEIIGRIFGARRGANQEPLRVALLDLEIADAVASGCLLIAGALGVGDHRIP